MFTVKNRRLYFVVAASIFFAFADCLWFYLTNKNTDLGENFAEIAQAVRVGGEASQRPISRILWQQISLGDSLREGQTIRTSADSQLRIMLKNGQYIDVAPDSIISLTMQEKEINLDLLGGAVKVSKLTDETGKSLLLKTSQGKIDLTKADATISKSEGNQIDLSVIGGKVGVESPDGKINEIASGEVSLSQQGAIEKTNPLRIASPQIGTPIYLDPNKPGKILFKWQGSPAGSRTKLLVGESRDQLAQMGLSLASGDSEIETNIPFGKHWFKLEAEDSTSGKILLQSSVQEIDVRRAYASIIIFPKSGTSLLLEHSNLNMEWITPIGAKEMRLEVSAEANFQSLKLTRTLDSQSSSMQIPLDPGSYYARILTFYPNSNAPVVGGFIQFKVIVNDPVQITFLIPNDKRVQYFSESPELNLSWEVQAGQNEISNYVVNLQHETDSNERPVELSTTKKMAKVRLSSAGKYLVYVDAFNSQGISVGRSAGIELKAEPAPLLLAPKLIAKDGILIAGIAGELSLAWVGVPGAVSYQVNLIGSDGKVTFSQKLAARSLVLQDLMPGMYTLQIESIDAYGRSSVDQVTKKVEVPNASSIAAPTVRAISIE